MGVEYKLSTTQPPRKLTEDETVLVINEQLDKRLAFLVGMPQGDGKRIIEDMVRDRIGKALDQEILRGAVQDQIEAILRELLGKYIKGPDTQELLERIEEDVEKAAIKAAQDLVAGLSFTPRMAAPAGGRKIVR